MEQLKLCYRFTPNVIATCFIETNNAETDDLFGKVERENLKRFQPIVDSLTKELNLLDEEIAQKETTLSKLKKSNSIVSKLFSRKYINSLIETKKEITQLQKLRDSVVERKEMAEDNLLLERFELYVKFTRLLKTEKYVFVSKSYDYENLLTTEIWER